jgi:Ca2+-binding RTX toxin-like protein
MQMATYSFSALTNGQHLTFNSATDALLFESTVSAGALTIAESGTALSITLSGKSIWLDSTTLSKLTDTSFQFANGGKLLAGDATTDTLADWYGADYSVLKTSTVSNWVAGLGGADYVQTGSGADWLIGNVALNSINHVSQIGGVGSPTSSTAPSISADGRYVGFDGGWTSFGSQNDNATDVFVKDLSSGTISNEHKSSSGAFGGSGAESPVISDDGRSLAFSSASSNLVSTNDSSQYDIYVATVGTTAIERVSTGNGETPAANGRSLNPDISGNGRYVVFESDTTNWFSGGNAESDIFLKDRTTDSLTRISTSLTGGDGDRDSTSAKVSNDGRFVVFESAASNLTSGDNNGYTDIFIWDRNSTAANKLTNLTSLMTFPVINPTNSCFNPDIAYDNEWGGKIVFETGRGLVAGDTNGQTDIYAFDMFEDNPQLSFQLVSSKADGAIGNLSSGNASISGDGRFVVFTSFANNLVAGDTNGYADIFVKDLITEEIALVSKAANGTQSNQSSGSAKISLGGEWIVFETSATNLSATDGNGGLPDVYRVSNPLLKDTLIGGAGNDTYVINRNDVITEAAGGGTDTVRSTISYALGANLENLTLTGTAAINGTGNALNNTITGNGAINTLTGAAGNDVLNGGAGADVMWGGSGNDTYYVDNASDVTNEAVSSTNTADAGGLDLVSSSVTRILGSYLENLTLTGTAAINGTGNALNNTITGNGAINTLTGAAGNDVLNGGAGADVMWGGSGNDTYYVDNASDVTNEAVSSTNTADAGGLDLVSSSVTRILGSYLENLTLTGTAAINGTGNALNNTITGNGAINTLTGAAGNDVLNGGAGADVMWGGSGNDTYYVDNASDVTNEAVSSTNTADAGGLDLVSSSVTRILGSYLENLTLTGTAAINGTGNALNNTITGNGAINTLTGAAGNDVLNGGAGADVMWGGSGNDTYYVDNASDVTNEAVSSTNTADAGGLDLVSSSVTRTLGSYLENLTLTGTAAINGTGNALNNTITGNGAINTLTGAAGNDVLNGGAGADVMWGGSGNDTYYVDNASDVTNEAVSSTNTADAGGLDLVSSSVTRTLGSYLENLTLTGTAAINGTGNALNNTITGNGAINTLTGAAGNDVLNGGAGADVMWGGSGNDTYYVDNASDVTNEAVSSTNTADAGGLDLVSSSVTRTLGSYLENLTLTGTAAINGTGNALNNTITGNGAINTLTGAAGNDVLNGGAGNDTLTGGTGIDYFDFTTALSSTTNVDTITDFSLVDDVIRLDNAVMAGLGTTTGTLTAAAFISGAGRVTAADATDRIVYNTTTGDLYYDADGSATASAAIKIAIIGTTSHPALTNADFSII